VNDHQIKAAEFEAKINWYDDGEKVNCAPKGFKKLYEYRSREVEAYLYDDCVIVFYKPTGIYKKFTDKTRGFQFARARDNHAKAVGSLLG